MSIKINSDLKINDEIALRNLPTQYVTTADTNLSDEEYLHDGYYFFGEDYIPQDSPSGTPGWLRTLHAVEDFGDLITKDFTIQIWYYIESESSGDENWGIAARSAKDGLFTEWIWLGSSEGSYLPLSGGTLSGQLTFSNGHIQMNNKSDFFALSKTRTVNGTDYQVDYGCGQYSNQGSIAMELKDASGTNLARCDITANNQLRMGAGSVEASAFYPSSYTSGAYINQYGNLISPSTLTSGFWQVSNNGTPILECVWSDNSVRTRGLYPMTDSTYSLGSSNYKWTHAYINELNMNGYIYTHTVIPITNAYYNIGASDKRYEHGYFKYINTSATATIGGNVDVSGHVSVNNSSYQSTYCYNKETVTSAPNLYVTSGGWFRRSTNTSSENYKTEIKDIEETDLNPELLYNIPIRQFKYKEDYQPDPTDWRYDRILPGFIAEEIKQYYPIAADLAYDEDKDFYYVDNWNEKYIIPPMLALIQKQHKEIEDLKIRIDEIEKKINK